MSEDQNSAKMLTEGDKAPEFTLETHKGKEISLSDYKGKYVALYFYPKDNTPGCTIQGGYFRDYYDEIVAEGAVILGVSADSLESHQKFAGQHGFQFDLLADPDKKVCKQYGVYAPKKIFGKEVMGIKRMTFLIGPEGDIIKVWRKANPKTNAGEVLEAIKQDKLS